MAKVNINQNTSCDK